MFFNGTQQPQQDRFVTFDPNENNTTTSCQSNPYPCLPQNQPQNLNHGGGGFQNQQFATQQADFQQKQMQSLKKEKQKQKKDLKAKYHELKVNMKRLVALKDNEIEQLKEKLNKAKESFTEEKTELHEEHNEKYRKEKKTLKKTIKSLEEKVQEQKDELKDLKFSQQFSKEQNVNTNQQFIKQYEDKNEKLKQELQQSEKNHDEDKRQFQICKEDWKKKKERFKESASRQEKDLKAQESLSNQRLEIIKNKDNEIQRLTAQISQLQQIKNEKDHREYDLNKKLEENIKQCLSQQDYIRELEVEIKEQKKRFDDLLDKFENFKIEQSPQKLNTLTKINSPQLKQDSQQKYYQKQLEQTNQLKEQYSYQQLLFKSEQNNQIIRQQKRSKQLMTQMKATYGKIEICFVIDITGSMDPYKEQTQKCIQETLKTVKLLTNRDAVFSTVCYQDFYEKQKLNELYQQHEFTEDHKRIEAFLNQIKCSGGDDPCEDVEGGLKQMCDKLKWSKPFKLAILICDCPGHGTRFNGGLKDNYPNKSSELEKVLEQMINNNIMLVGLNFTKHTIQMYQEFEKIFSQRGKPEYFMKADLATINQGDVWKELANKITQASIQVTQTKNAQTKSNNKLNNNYLEGAIEVLCKGGVLTDFDKQQNIKSIPQGQISMILNKIYKRLKEEGVWECVRTQDPYAKGMFKQVFLMKKKNCINENELYVIKSPLRKENYQSKHEAIMECRSHLISQSFIKLFNKEINNAYQENGEQNKYPNVCYSDFLILEESSTQYWIAERFFIGEFVKYNNNNGYINDQLQTPISRYALAFSYYTYIRSDFKYMIVDIQGVGNYLTDPAINTVEGKFDSTDIGIEGISNFMVVFESKYKICEEILNLLQIDPY